MNRKKAPMIAMIAIGLALLVIFVL